MTYTINEAIGLSKDLLILYYNDPSYKSIKSEFLQKELLIEILSIKYSETNQKWIVYQTATLKV